MALESFFALAIGENLGAIRMLCADARDALAGQLEIDAGFLERFQKLRRTVDVQLLVVELGPDVPFEIDRRPRPRALSSFPVRSRDREPVKFHLGDDGEKFSFRDGRSVEVAA